MKTTYLTFFTFASMLFLCHEAYAQQQNNSSYEFENPAVILAQQDQIKPVRSLELSIGKQYLTNDYAAWKDISLSGVYGVGRQVFQVELSSKKEFNQTGHFLGVADTITVNDDWFARVSVGAGNGSFYLPHVRSDLFLYKKWFDKRNFVSSLGIGYYSSPDGHIDRNINLGATYYFEKPWILQGGIRFNRSNPGQVETHQQFIAVTYGRDKQNLLTVRGGWGGEAYQQISSAQSIVNFQSREVSVLWHHWLNADTGYLLSVERYSNPLYERVGAHVGFFYQF
ncbi:YaiO family outer membrane beta-barrel protein [Undibacterium sp. SXout7W]|uniref:YaiO family outer membrane beta-barrel protein n=1 Tax=Undibacterium sp. SXout7W TaxID=3413049 RepID=UPI003BF10956